MKIVMLVFTVKEITSEIIFCKQNLVIKSFNYCRITIYYQTRG